MSALAPDCPGGRGLPLLRFSVEAEQLQVRLPALRLLLLAAVLGTYRVVVHDVGDEALGYIGSVRGGLHLFPDSRSRVRIPAPSVEEAGSRDP